MDLFRIVYWGLSYTAGIVCMTVLALQYLRSKEIITLKLIGFLLPFGASVVSLSMMEAYSGHPAYEAIFGTFGLVGASLVTVAFPSFALSFDPIKRRKRLNLIFTIGGWVLAAANVVAFFLPSSQMSVIYFLTILMLGAAIFIGMGWISRSRPSPDEKSKPTLMAKLMPSLFIGFGLAFAFDLLRNFVPALGFLGKHYLFFPGFYGILNVFLAIDNAWLSAPNLVDEKVLKASDRLGAYGISDREAEVLAYLARGRTYREIADSLYLSLATVKTHISHLYEKTGTHNKVELINLIERRIGHSADSPPPTSESTQ